LDHVICDTDGFPADRDELAVVATDGVIFLHHDAGAALRRLALYDQAMDDFRIPRAVAKDVNTESACIGLGCGVRGSPPRVDGEINKLWGFILSVLGRGADGLTPWARVRGRPFDQQVVCFGEVVLYKLPVKGTRSQPDGNMGTTQGGGVFVGYHRSSNTSTLATADGKVEARSLTRRPEPNRWSAEKLAEIKATPWSRREKPESSVCFEQPAGEAAVPPGAVRPSAPKEFRINQSDISEHGYSGGCA
jgi:hypothetical protein